MALSYPQIERAVSELFHDYTQVTDGSLPEIDIVSAEELLTGGQLPERVLVPWGVVMVALRAKRNFYNIPIGYFDRWAFEAGGVGPRGTFSL